MKPPKAVDEYRRRSRQTLQRRRCGSVVPLNLNRRMVTMIEPKLEVPAELRDLAEKTIDQAEKAFGMFFDAANKSMASVPNPGTEISKQALLFHRTEYEGCVRSCAKTGSRHRSSGSNANSIGILEESVHQCRRAYETDHRRGHGCREGWVGRQVLIRCPQNSLA